MLELFLVPASWLYGSIVWLRNKCYDARIFGAAQAGVPVISVGNLTAGGTGKTPFVEYLVQYFMTRKKKVAVLSRGYRRTTSGTIVVSDGQTLKETPERSGDEPFQIARRFPGAVVISDKRRARSAKIAVDRYHADVILLDDGFQHRAIGRDLDIVMINDAHSPVRMPMLPAGLRREPMSSLRRAGLLAMSGPTGAGVRYDDLRKFSTAPEISIWFMPDRVSPLYNGETLSKESLRGKLVMGFCGIANPERFTEMLEELGAEIRDTLIFRDHHRFTPGDLQEIRRRFERSGSVLILTTEKDAVRLAAREGESSLQGLPVYFVTIRTVVVDGRELLHSLLDRLTGGLPG
jgi:tetraacyldisaccharide 4'-kinase